ncbi:MAG: hypothetical protein ACYS0D_03970 [Planctomycetota bacterium]
MSKLSIRLALLTAAVTAGCLVAIALGADRELTTSGGDVRGFIVPAAQIVSFDDTVGLLNTATGAIYKLRGNLDNASVTNTWQMRVGPVDGTTSGYLEIQRPVFDHPNAIFLVDIVTGKTWILRDRASSNRSWEPVKIHRSSQFH